jgi:rare lipoprotein A
VVVPDGPALVATGTGTGTTGTGTGTAATTGGTQRSSGVVVGAATTRNWSAYRRQPSRPATTTTSTTVPPTTTTAAPDPSQTGPASWYDASSGSCAHKTLPFGTVVRIVNLANGATATCTVDDRGPYEGDRIIDLSPDVFSKLAPLSEGVIDVRISW